jgi:hypothetical protein
MRVSVAVDGKAFKAVLERDAAAMAEASERAIEETTTRIKERGRVQLRLAFPSSRRVPNTLRGEFYPARGGKPAAGYVYSAWFKRGHDLLFAFATGATIRAPDGKLMLVPFDRETGGPIRARAALDALRQGAPRIAIVRTRSGRFLLVERRNKRTDLLGTFARSVKMPRKGRLDELPAAAERLLGERMLAQLEQKGL